MSTTIILTQAFLETACESLERQHNQALENKRTAFKELNSKKHNTWPQGIHLDSIFNANVLATNLLRSLKKSKMTHTDMSDVELTMIAEDLIDDPHDAEVAVDDLMRIAQEPLAI